PHITHGFQSLSVIIRRLVQDSYGKLLELVDNIQDGNDAVRRKRIMKYLMDTRHQFIKCLVLTQWAGKNEDMSTVIDLKVWMDSQRFQYEKVVWDLLDVRRSLTNAKSVEEMHHSSNWLLWLITTNVD